MGTVDFEGHFFVFNGSFIVDSIYTKRPLNFNVCLNTQNWPVKQIDLSCVSFCISAWLNPSKDIISQINARRCVGKSLQMFYEWLRLKTGVDINFLRLRFWRWRVRLWTALPNLLVEISLRNSKHSASVTTKRLQTPYLSKQLWMLAQFFYAMILYNAICTVLISCDYNQCYTNR